MGKLYSIFFTSKEKEVSGFYLMLINRCFIHCGGKNKEEKYVYRVEEESLELLDVNGYKRGIDYKIE